MIPEYHYRIEDDSLVLPFFKRRIVSPLFSVVPRSLPANMITIFSNILMYMALVAALIEFPVRSLRFIVIAVLVFGYLIGDHFDGMQAKRTGTSSALGEFCDHFLDVFNNGILVFIVCLSFEITNPALVAIFLTAGYLTHAIIFHEQFHSKCLRFGKFGSLESAMILSTLMLICAIEPVYRFFMQKLFGVYTLAELFFIVSSIGAIATFMHYVIRTGVRDFLFWLFCVLLISLSVASVFYMPPSAIFYIITACSTIYIGNLQRGHLVDGKNRIPEIAAPVFIVLAFVFEPLRNKICMYALYIYLACRIFLITCDVVYSLRRFWVWKNPA